MSVANIPAGGGWARLRAGLAGRRRRFERADLTSRVAEITVLGSRFSPATVDVAAGDVRLLLRVAATERACVVAVPALGRAVTVAPGRTAPLDLRDLQPGTYTLRCDLGCGRCTIRAR